MWSQDKEPSWSPELYVLQLGFRARSDSTLYYLSVHDIVSCARWEIALGGGAVGFRAHIKHFWRQYWLCGCCVYLHFLVVEQAVGIYIFIVTMFCKSYRTYFSFSKWEPNALKGFMITQVSRWESGLYPSLQVQWSSLQFRTVCRAQARHRRPACRCVWDGKDLPTSEKQEESLLPSRWCQLAQINPYIYEAGDFTY